MGSTLLNRLAKTIAVISTLTATTPYARLRNWAVGQTFATTNGNIIGHAAPKALEVSEYLGIPFAQPPLGSLRFEPPIAYNGSSTYKASSFVN